MIYTAELAVNYLWLHSPSLIRLVDRDASELYQSNQCVKSSDELYKLHLFDLCLLKEGQMVTLVNHPAVSLSFLYRLNLG